MSDGREGLDLGRIAQLVEGRIEQGDSTRVIRGIASLELAEADELGVFADRRYRDAAAATSAGALVVSESLLEHAPPDRPLVVVQDAFQALLPLLDALHPPRPARPGVHPTAVLGCGVRLGEGVEIAPYVVLDEDVTVGDRVRIGAHSVVGAGCTIGEDSRLEPHVVLYPGTMLGRRVILHAGVRMGSDGFGYLWQGDHHAKVRQVGRLVIEDDVEVGANCAIDRGALSETRIGQGTKLDNLVHIAHNVRLGPHCMLTAQTGIAGSAEIGAGVLFGGQSGAAGHLVIGDGARVAAASKVFRSVPAGQTVSGIPSRPNREYLRTHAHLERLPKLVERVGKLEGALERLEKAASPAGGAGDSSE